jgi:hypothetical protein
MGRKKEAEPVVTKSVREIILERLKALDGDKKTAISWRTFKRKLLTVNGNKVQLLTSCGSAECGIPARS